MNENSVKPISSLRAMETSMPGRVNSLDKTENAAFRQQASDVDKAVKRADSGKDQSKHISNISIHFNVDDETNRLVVVVTERESGRVLRTIPASEFEKMQAGDLLKLKA
jgi:uncharacterized FlaG/YvyC family protein